MKTLHTYHTYHCITGFIIGFSSPPLFISAMASEQSIKDLQAQNVQFQQMFISLEKAQEDLKSLILKEKKKKKKVVDILNMAEGLESG